MSTESSGPVPNDDLGLLTGCEPQLLEPIENDHLEENET
jgi:hypothetical protein